VIVQEKIEQLFLFFQERCLWQFHSRSWDREDNINGISEDVIKLLTGKRVSMETPEDKCHYADSRILVDQLKSRFPWIMEMTDADRRAVVEGACEKLTAVTVTNSRNAELTNQNY
jgi:Vanadium/alternative nitrogenase delta subunit.